MGGSAGGGGFTVSTGGAGFTPVPFVAPQPDISSLPGKSPGGIGGLFGSFGKILEQASPLLKFFGQRRQASAQAQVFEFNAAVHRQRADLIRKRTALDVERQRRRARSFRKKQEALFAKAGVRLTGSPLEVIAESAAELEFDALLTQFEGDIEALNASTSAAIALTRAQQIEQAGFVSAGTTLLTQLTPNFAQTQSPTGSIRFR